jgi:hypothetical protein
MVFIAFLPLRPWGRRGQGEVGETPKQPTSPSQSFGLGPSLSPQSAVREKGER